MATKTFSKSRWLAEANRQKEQGILTQAEIDNAFVTWVNSYDGKTAEQNNDDRADERFYV